MNQPTITSRRAGFTLAELMIVVALLAIVAAIVVKVKQINNSSRLSVETLAFSSDGVRLLVAFNDGSVQAWNWADRRQIASLPPLNHWSEVAFSPEGNVVARCYYAGLPGKQDALELRDMGSGKEIRQVDIDELPKMAFSPDGNWLAIAERGAEKLRFIPADDPDAPELNLGKLVRSQTDAPQDLAPIFSSDGRRLYHVNPERRQRFAA